MGAFLPRCHIGPLVAVVMGLAPLPSLALKTTTLAVTAEVTPSAVFGVEFTSQPIVITQADFDRGYVDVVMKSRMRLQMTQNASRPAKPLVMVDLAAREDVFRSVSLSSLAARDVSAPGEGQSSEFRYRFELSSHASVGSYATSVSVGIDL